MSEATIPARTPPHSYEAERGVLGSILIDASSPNGERVFDICQTKKLTPAHFYDPRNYVIYETMLNLSHANQRIDHITLLDELRATNRMETVGGIEYLQSLYDQTPTSDHAEYYIEIVLRKYRRRRLIEIATKAIEKSYDEGANPHADDILGETEKNLLSLDLGNENEPMSVTMDRVLKDVFSLALSSKCELKGLPTGFKQLDEKMQGLPKGKMIVIGARPSIGKTSLAMNIAENVAIAGHRVLVFSLEMSRDDLIKRMVSSGARVNLNKLRTREVDDPDERLNMANRFGARLNELKQNGNLNIQELPGADIMSLIPMARRDMKNRHTELIILDYLQLCSCRTTKRQDNRQLEVAEISRQLKGMARELDVPVIVLSQLSRDSVRDGVNPQLNHLRDSGAIEQDADIVLLLRRPVKDGTSPLPGDMRDEKLAYINVAKNRDGETGEIALQFEGEYTRFSD